MSARGGGGWETSRHDDGLGVTHGPPSAYREWVEVRTNDHRWTTNGRVREHSRTTTRTIRQGVRSVD